MPNRHHLARSDRRTTVVALPRTAPQPAQWLACTLITAICMVAITILSL